MDSKGQTARTYFKSARGFSLIEALAVTLIVLISSTVAVNQLKNSKAVLDADTAANLVNNQFRYARQVAADQRHNVRIEFLGTNEIKLTRQEGGVDTDVISDVTLPSGFTFSMPAGVADTPDGYGNDAPVYFNASTNGIVQADGVFTTGLSGVVTNGTVFTKSSATGTARAISLTGASGRTTVYLLRGTSWAERNY